MYSTPTCAPCKAAGRRLDREGIPFTKVDLTAEPEILAELKRRLETEIISTPLLQYGSTFRQIDGLHDIITNYREDHE